MTAPLLPDGGSGLASALALGVAFGFFLERAGLGNARKLAAQFHFTDLTVFKVLFTAVVAAMLGAFWLGRIGVLDLGAVYVPETWLLPQLAGGAVFGAGFAIAGLCPGTSCIASASGRLDGVAAMAGMFVGIAVFDAAFPAIRPFYDATPRGTLTIPGLLGLDTGVVALFVVAVALAAFLAAERIERSHGAGPVEP